jgi:hypothetical protein
MIYTTYILNLYERLMVSTLEKTEKTPKSVR